MGKLQVCYSMLVSGAWRFIFFGGLLLHHEPLSANRQKPLQYQALMQVPVLCYHNIKPAMTGHQPGYTISIKRFEEQMQWLWANGYHTITPGQLYAHYTNGMALPRQPIIISFDDAHEEDFSIVAPLLDQKNMKAVFFIMTVVIGKKGYLTARQINALAGKGHIIGLHTWNHPDLRKLKDNEWALQLDTAAATLRSITGTNPSTFAYPFGAWNEACIQQLQKRGIQTAFQLEGRGSTAYPMYTLRRLLVNGNWSGPALEKRIQSLMAPSTKHRTE
ncbi:MAG TPA: polysaccharide deacetylase family protein [Chitinophagaceae bacterium]|nr:polysaccharide deacetylase family protein [Chitinophagaceae bacterium]